MVVLSADEMNATPDEFWTKCSDCLLPLVEPSLRRWIEQRYLAPLETRGTVPQSLTTRDGTLSLRPEKQNPRPPDRGF